MPSPDLIDENRLRAAEVAFRHRMMQNALFHLVNSGIDPIDGMRFQQLGYFQEVQSSVVPSSVVDILKDKGHSSRVNVPDGPLLFIREDQKVAVIDLTHAVLQPNCGMRTAVAEYIASSANSHEPWVSDRTRSVFANNVHQLTSEESEWRTAAIEASSAIEDDFMLHCAGVRQALAARYSEGVDQYARYVIRPGFHALGCIRPPVWSVKEQRNEIQSWLSDLSTRPTIGEALDEYLQRCGYLPLRGDLGAAALVLEWSRRNKAVHPKWDDIWAWATKCNSPAARYHAVAIAVTCPELRPTGDTITLYQEMAAILGGAESDVTSALQWQLFCESAVHYSRHLEALYPAQDGERVACFAWWLAHQFGQLMWRTGSLTKAALVKMIEPEQELSTHRWLIARSPVAPSSFRYFTLSQKNVWAMSMFGECRRSSVPLALDQLSPALRESLATTFQSCMIPAIVADHCDEANPAFAFEGGMSTASPGALAGLLDAEHVEGLSQTTAFRESMADNAEFLSNLERLTGLPPEHQFVMLLCLKSAVCSTRKFDDVVGPWLERPDCVVELVESLPIELLPTILEILVEFQQRQWNDLPLRIPHAIAYAVERMDDRERVKTLLPFILVLSVNVGIVSPIQRVFASRWRAQFVETLQVWRDHMSEIGRHSEPWIAARVRGAVSAISRLIGPRLTTREREPGTTGQHT